MQKIKLSVISIILLTGIAGCDKANENSAPASSSAPAASASGTGKAVTFVTTQDGSPMAIKPELFDTPAAKEFLATGKNSYVGNAEAVAKGKKLFQLYSCTQCHGPEAGGQVGPGLVGPDYRYPKDATNKGMFETIWHGTNGGMGAKGKGLMDPSDPTNGLSVDETLQIIAWVRSHSKITGNE
jgi:cytochrome c-L